MVDKNLGHYQILPPIQVQVCEDSAEGIRRSRYAGLLRHVHERGSIANESTKVNHGGIRRRRMSNTKNSRMAASFSHDCS